MQRNFLNACQAEKVMKTLFLILCTVFYMQYADGKSAPVNAIIGDESFLAKFSRDPFEADEVLRIQTHLSYVEMKLRNADVSHLSKVQTERRMKALDLLHRYWLESVPALLLYHTQYSIL